MSVGKIAPGAFVPTMLALEPEARAERAAISEDELELAPPKTDPPRTTQTSGKRLKPLNGPPAPITLVSIGPLSFDAPFGEGQDRHEGVRAASALVRLGDALLIPQDDSAFAAVWTASGVTPLRLFEGEALTFSEARGNKASKPDLELGASFLLGGSPAAVLFGSGSTAARMRAVIVRGPEGPVVTVDLSSLYAAAARRLGLEAGALNLEGAASSGDEVVFFQRGNGPGGVNASFRVPIATLEAALLEGAPVEAHDLREVRRHLLGSLDGCALGFSDATPLPDGRVLFLAAAEDSPSTFDDGAIAGSVIGVLELDGSARVLARVPDGPDGPLKLEGLAVERLDGRMATVIAVEDADDPAKPSTAVRLLLDLESKAKPSR